MLNLRMYRGLHTMQSIRNPKIKSSHQQLYSPQFQESALTVAMIKHRMDVVKSAVEHLNREQTPILTIDQPLFSLAKLMEVAREVQSDKLVVMFGGLHITLRWQP